MAMNGDVLGSAIKSAVDGISPPTSSDQVDAYRLQLFQAIGTAIVAHIETFAVVSSTVAVTSVSGVTTGGGTSGPGTGTAVGTIA